MVLPVLTLDCTALSEFDIHQCRTHKDCDILGAAIARCEQSRCTEGCADNAHCASVDPRLPLCEHPGGDCVGPISAGGECYVSAGLDSTDMAALTVEDMIVVGAFSPTLRSSSWLTIQLAADEINAAGGLPGTMHSRPVLGVLCDPSRQSMDTATDHLVNSLHARAILATLDDDTLQAALERSSTSASALFLSPNGFDAHNSASPDPNARGWYLGADYRQAVDAYAPVLQRAVGSLVARGKDQESVRIAVLVSEAKEDVDLSIAVAGVVNVGSKSAQRLELEYRYLTFHLDRSEAQLEAIIEYAPDIVLVFSGGVSLASPYPPRVAIIEELEARTAGTDWLPFYVFGSRSAQEARLGYLASTNASFRSRALGVRSDRAVEPGIANGVTARYERAFPLSADSQLPLAASLGAYDAFYFLAYAVAAAHANSGLSTAAAVAAGLARITDPTAERIDIGPGEMGLSRAAELLVSGTPFNLHGTTGAADFDPESRARPSAVRVFCWASDGTVLDRAFYDVGSQDLELLVQDCAQEALDASSD